jgi:ABC-type transport system substrate-binding protein
MEQIPGFGPDKEANRAQAREIIKRKGLEGYTVGISAWAALRPSTAGSLAVCGMLQKVGMNCTTNFMEVGPYYSMVNARRIPKGEVVVHPSGPSLNSVDVSLGEVFHPDGARNYGAYPRDPVLLDLYAKQSAEQDPEVRGELVREYQRYFLSKHYHILLAQRGVGAFWASNIHNLSDGLIFTWPSRLDNVWIE